MDPERATHWQEAWTRAGIGRARVRPGSGKFFALVAYPGASGFLHVGHLRGYAYGDPLHRYHRMLGEEVLFPFGVHASGLPAVAWARQVQERSPTVVQQLEDHQVPTAEWAGLEDPAAAARFLGRSYLRDLRRLGVMVDETTYVTTIDDDYQAFIRWQFRALQAAGALRQGPYFAAVCPVCGPVAVDPSETDISAGGDAEVTRYTTIPFRLPDGRTLLAATLRPETVWGVTNLWLAPDAELVVWHHGSDEFLVARAGAERLVEQHGGRLGHTVAARELQGRTVRVPLRDVEVPVLESRFVDPQVGTGVVMSVPAHAPWDAAALASLPPEDRTRLGPIPVVLEVPTAPALTSSEEELTAGDGTPAERALRATGARGLDDVAAIEAATERLYRLEFARGRMTVAPLAGVPVREARERAVEELRRVGPSFDLQEFSKPVICRNGHAVVIRRVEDQWFLTYGDPAWKALVRSYLPGLSCWPADYGRDLPAILDWYEDRPCTRKGPWLGTPFPLDPTWTIEPIADSTFYMAFFVVRPFVADGRVAVTQLTDAFFDYVFRGQGPGEPSVPRPLLDEIRAAFEFWYPLDLNISGKEHKRVHLPVFVATHAKLLGPGGQPKGIFVHGWITGDAGAKISKKEVSSKGGRIPTIDRALERWGPDPIRLASVLSASPSQDFAWSDDAVDAAAERLTEVERLLRETEGDGAGPAELDAWLRSRLHELVRRYHAAFGACELRDAAEIAYAELPNLLRRYYTRGGVPGDATTAAGRAWVRLIAPITPHLAEEVGHGWFGGLVAVARMPTIDDFPRSEAAEAREAYLDRVEDDVRAVLRPAKERGEPAPEALVLYLAAPWKSTIEAWVRDGLDAGAVPPVKDLLERAQGHPELAAHRAEIARYVQRVAPLLRAEPAPLGPPVPEAEVLREAEGYLVRRFGFRAVTVVEEGAAEALDPLHRRDRARPGRPAFYLTRAGEARPEA